MSRRYLGNRVSLTPARRRFRRFLVVFATAAKVEETTENVGFSGVFIGCRGGGQGIIRQRITVWRFSAKTCQTPHIVHNAILASSEEPAGPRVVNNGRGARPEAPMGVALVRGLAT